MDYNQTFELSEVTPMDHTPRTTPANSKWPVAQFLDESTCPCPPPSLPSPPPPPYSWTSPAQCARSRNKGHVSPDHAFHAIVNPLVIQARKNLWARQSVGLQWWAVACWWYLPCDRFITCIGSSTARGLKTGLLEAVPRNYCELSPYYWYHSNHHLLLGLRCDRS